MAKGGFVSYEKACQMIEDNKNKQHKPYTLSRKAQEVLRSAKNSSDSKGKLHLSNRLVEGMKEVGVNFYNSNVPKHYSIEKGGFDNAVA